MFLDELEELDRRMTRGHATQRALLHGVGNRGAYSMHGTGERGDYIEWRTSHKGTVQVDVERVPDPPSRPSRVRPPVVGRGASNR